ncbi:hypothetical protein [Streptomyces stelliscabiei]|uniref:Uncharacterized protein n=1 Tax=Streptomyces stelliscabiei TaxID=146820 RepID=A0A8I0PAM6_9ACTN|nr:hypothetical protein [Streptomyces stelliscabiei]KND29926.1 hypothetical protein IQ64_41650 [Streptomyces stelliscabiei]MBE1598965.1 hypothetical protein [Streptomyces stelliscabiei]
MAKVDDDLAHLEHRVRAALQSNRLIVLRWYRPDATGLERWLRNALDDPRCAAARVPGRLACRLLGRHSWTCIGHPSPRHPRTW